MHVSIIVHLFACGQWARRAWYRTRGPKYMEAQSSRRTFGSNTTMPVSWYQLAHVCKFAQGPYKLLKMLPNATRASEELAKESEDNNDIEASSASAPTSPAATIDPEMMQQPAAFMELQKQQQPDEAKAKKRRKSFVAPSHSASSSPASNTRQQTKK